MAENFLVKGEFECLESPRLSSVLERYSDSDQNFQICEHVSGIGKIEKVNDLPLLIFHSEGDSKYIDIDYFEKQGTVLHCNVKLKDGKFFNYWAYDYLTHIKEWGVKINQKNSFVPKFLCLNGRPDWHRYYTLQRLMDTKLLGQGLVSFLNRYDQLGNDIYYQEFKDRYKNPTYAIDAMRENKNNLVLDRSNREIHKNDRLHDSWIYEQTSISLVTETYPEAKRGLFITEKTWKPIANSHFAIYIGQPGTLEFLRGLGFDTFDDILDNEYDEIQDDLSRFESAYESLSKYLTSIENLDKDKIQKRLTDNQEKYLSMRIDQRQIDEWV
jgi:hypothetical protein